MTAKTAMNLLTFFEFEVIDVGAEIGNSDDSQDGSATATSAAGELHS